MPEISVILPVYNSAEYLPAAIESVLNQDFGDFEFIIINDGSTDKSEEIIHSFKDKRIICLKNEKNIGLIKTLNRGIDAARGKYIARMDADDACLPDRFSNQYRYMEAHPETGVLGTAYFLWNNSTLKRTHVFTNNSELRTLLMFNSCFCHPSVMIRKSCLINADSSYNENELHVEDYGLWMRLSSHTQLANLDVPLLQYRHHAGQVSLVKNEEQKKNAQVIREAYLRKLGFTLTETQSTCHNMVAENSFITKITELKNIEAWFKELKAQNDRKLCIEKSGFNTVLGKMWYDTCGNTNLGITAYRTFFQSALADDFPISLKQKTKLAVKCLLRKFKN